MSGLLHANAATQEADSGLGPDDDTFEPLVDQSPTSAEVTSILFPSDAGGVGYLFGHDLFDAAPTPLDAPPAPAANPAANAMNAANDDAGDLVYSTHAGTPLGGPVVTPEFDPQVASEKPVQPLGPTAETATQRFARVTKAEWKRFTSQLTIERGSGG